MVEEPADIQTLLAFHLIPGVGRARFEQLENVFGSARAALNAPRSRLQAVKGIGKTFAERISEAKDLDAVKRELDLAEKNGIKVISYNDDAYPATLLKTADPPLILYVKGELRSEDAVCVSMVGARKCSFYGRTCAERIASGLAREGLTIVSGMARGIDSASHNGALSAPGGRTIAVLGSGLLNIYPPENEGLFKRISESGAVISEFKLQTEPAKGNFPRRNRIIAWMGLGTIVIEAGKKSGSLITARYAMEENRDVFAVPGKIDSPLSVGPHHLIRDGAILVTSPYDILDEFQSILEPIRDMVKTRRQIVDERSPKEEPTLFDQPENDPENDEPEDSADEPKKPARSKKSKLSSAANESKTTAYPQTADALERKILDAFSGSDPIHIDAIIETVGAAAGAVAGSLTILELRRWVERLPGNRYVRRTRK